MNKLTLLFVSCFVGLVSTACAQNATRPQKLSTGTSRTGLYAAVAVQNNSDVRHFAVVECQGSTCYLQYWRKGAEDRQLQVASNTNGIANPDIAALDDGSAVLIWTEGTASTTTYQYAIVSAAGIVSGPFDLNQPGATLGDPIQPRDRPRVAAGGGVVYAAYISGAPGTEKLWYRQIFPGFSPAGLVKDVTPLGGTSYIDGPRILVDSAAGVHVAWRHVKTGAGGFSEVAYAYHTGGGSPAMAPVTVINSGGGPTVGLPGMVLDDRNPTVRAHVGSMQGFGGGDQTLRSSQLDAGVLASTLTLLLPAAENWVRPGIVAPELTLYGANTLFAFAASNTVTGGATEAFTWSSTSTAAVRISSIGNVSQVRAQSIRFGPSPVVAYIAGDSTASGLYAYDVANGRTILVSTDSLCVSAFCGSFDFAGHGETASGVWLGKALSDTIDYAYEARNDNTPTGRITVNTTDDIVVSDSNISLREALLIANGTIASGFSPGEQAQLQSGGCIFNSGGNIIGGCGSGITDTISISVTGSGVIGLASPLPIVNDSAPTNINGPNPDDPLLMAGRGPEAIDTPSSVTIDGTGLAGLTSTLVLSSSNNSVSGLTLLGGQRGLHVSGNANRVSFVNVYSNSTSAIDIDGGDRNQIQVVTVGLPYGATTCGLRPAQGTWLHNGAQDNSFYFVRAGCASGYGFVIEGAGTDRNLIYASLAGSPDSASTANSLGGVSVAAGAKNNIVAASTMNFNGGPGLTLSDAGTMSNTVLSSRIDSNSGEGVLITSGPSENIITGTTVASNTTGIRDGSGAPNYWFNLSTFGNAGLGVDQGAGGVPNPPSAVISSYSFTSGEMRGTFSPTVDSTIQIYAAAPDPSGFGEGKNWLTTTQSVDGNWLAYVPSGNTCFTLIQTNAAGSSEFTQVWCRYAVYLPVTVR